MHVSIGPYRPSGSGMASYTRHLCNSLVSSNVAVTLFGYELDPPPADLDRRVRAISLGTDPRWLDICGPAVVYGQVRARIKVLVKRLAQTTDLFHSPYGTGYFDSLDVPLVLTGWSYGNALDMMRYGTKSFDSWRRVIGGLGHLAYYLEDARGYRSADACLFTTRAGRDFWRRMGANTIYIPCPVNAPQLGPPSEGRSGRQGLRFLVGERDLSRPRNNVGLFLKCCARLSGRDAQQCIVTLVGGRDSGLHESIRAATLAGVRVRHHAYLTRLEFIRLLAESDVFVQLRDIIDHGGYAALEAMASGKALLVSDSPGFSDFVTDSVNGFVVSPGQEAALLTAIQRFASDSELASAFGRNGARIASTEHSYESVGRSMLEFYRELLPNR